MEKNQPAMQETPGSGRSPGEGNGNPLQYSCLENPIDGGAWWATVHGVSKSWSQLSDFTFTSLYRRDVRVPPIHMMKACLGSVAIYGLRK